MEQINARSIFSPATGFIQRGGFDWTCNPYIGCTFSCQYCYAAFLPQNRRPREDWGRWLAGTVAGMVYALAVYRRGSLGDAVVAHAVTNALIAATVLCFGAWGLWS